LLHYKVDFVSMYGFTFKLSILSQLLHNIRIPLSAHTARALIEENLSILSQLLQSDSEQGNVRTKRLSILSQLLPDLLSWISVAPSSQEPRWLSILSQLLRTSQNTSSITTCLPFQFFPSCFPEGSLVYVRSGGLSILSQLLPEPPAEEGARGIGMLNFQFFPSCFMQTPVKLEEKAPASFNSFPVASAARADRVDRGEPVFQFFPSCFHSVRYEVRPELRDADHGDFQFFPSCFLEGVGAATDAAEASFNSFPVASAVCLGPCF